MDYKKIIEEGELIYSSRTEDTMFREWKLAKTMCNVDYFTVRPLTKLDKVILLTLNQSGRIYENQLAKILGFNVEDDFDVNPKRYADDGENGIFQGILSIVKSYGLVNRHDNFICLTNIGNLALKMGVKYTFYRGAIALMESFDLEPKESLGYKMLPFRDGVGIISQIQHCIKIKYEDFDTPDLEECLYGNHSELVNQLSLQCDTEVNIFKAEKCTESRMGEIFVDFRLYKINGRKYPLIFHNDAISNEITDLLLQEYNRAYIDEKIHIGEYLYVVRESNEVLDYQTLIPYIDVWNLDDFLNNKRLDWSDDHLFTEIAKKANGSQWNVISKVCPIDDLERHLTEYKDSLDWIILSTRYDDNFIVNSAILYPWDFETLAVERSAEFVKRVTVIPELHKEIDWDWEVILSKLEDEFVISNIADIPFDMNSETEKYLSKYPNIIVDYPERKWNWNYVSEESDLSFILKNISAFSNYLHLESVMQRAFMSEYKDSYCNSGEFAFAIIQKKEWLQGCYFANTADYSWTIKLIDWHEKMGFVTWKSELNTVGLECNKGISWNSETFDHYKDREFSIKGLNHISKSITDNEIITLNPDFKWNWSILSGRDIVTNDIVFIEKHLNDLSLDIAIPTIAASHLTTLYKISGFRQLVSEQKVWDKLTDCIEKDTILNNITDSNWDWHVITQNFCSTLNFAALEKLNVLNKLDWDYISNNAEISKILEKLDDYVDRWNWHVLTERFDHDFIIDNLPEYYKYWDWYFIVSKVLTETDLSNSDLRIELATIFSQFDEELKKGLWVALTARYSTEDIFTIIQTNPLMIDGSILFAWNYSDVYNRPDFDINKILAEYKESEFPIDWETLSSSKVLNKILSWDKKNIKEFSDWEEFVLSFLTDTSYHWDFKYLSTLSSINWCNSILQAKESYWDWSYLSEHSAFFSYNEKRPSEIVKRIRRFDKHIDFGILSKRKDMQLNAEMMSYLLKYNWDWATISSNKGFSLTADFVEDNKNFPWNWHELSSRKDCKFSPKFILENYSFEWDWQSISKRKDIQLTSEIIKELIEKDWDWKVISGRTDIKFEEDMLPYLVDKDIDWNSFSRRADFFPTMNTLNLLKDKDIDWNAISERMELSYEVIVVFKNKLNWTKLTNSNHIDLSNPKVLETFKDNLDWTIVSSSSSFIPSFENLMRFKDNVNWINVCKRSDIVIDIPFLNAFEDCVDWSRISQCGTIAFSQELIDKYKDKWDWVSLAKNPAFRSSGVEKMYREELKLLDFYNSLKKCTNKPSIYHFTHLFNAIEVIKTRKILSRNRATELGLLKYDAAGSVVHRSSSAHPYARFYYRTGTQTQFYNECLGKQPGNKYFSRAESNGLPMCPMPVFFKFDLQEVLTKYPDLCYYSTGNMQTGWAKVYKVKDAPDNIDPVNLYSNGWDKTVQEKKQQEFLVKNEFDFSKLNNYKIICYDSEETEILRSMFKGDPICNHIFCVYDKDAESVFENENPPLEFNISKQHIEINTSYKGNYIFQIESAQISKIKVNNQSSDIKTIKGHMMQLRDYVSVECGEVPFDIYYVNLSPYARSPRWLVYHYTPEVHEEKITDSDIIEKYFSISFEDEFYSPDELVTSLELIMPKLEGLYNTQVRHYVVKKHTLLVCKQFEKYAFNFDTNYMSIDIMRVVLALHDIGKAIDRANQHEHTLSIINEFWKQSPFTEYERKLTGILLKNDNMGTYFKGEFGLENLVQEIIEDAKTLKIPTKVLLQYKMILYQCDVSSYTEDAGGLKYLEHMFKYEDGKKVFDDNEGIIAMSSVYVERYNKLKIEING